MDRRDLAPSPSVTDPNPEPEARPTSGAARPSADLSAQAGRSGSAGRRSRELGNVELRGLDAYYGPNHAVKDIDLRFDSGEVTAIIGPSGCGKSTMVRCINRMHEEIEGARVEGEVLLDGLDLYDPRIDIVAVRRTVGMVFQKPNPFPTMSVIDNVTAGLRLTGAGRGEARGTRSRGPDRRRPLGRGQGPARRRPGRVSRAVSSSASASPGRSRSSPRCC